MSILNGPDQEAAALAREAVKAASAQNRDLVLSNLSIAQALLAIATAIRESGTPGDFLPQDDAAVKELTEAVEADVAGQQKIGGPSLSEQIRQDLRDREREEKN